jgi:hypothetical protein
MTTTWNPSDKEASLVLSGGNLTATGSGTGFQQRGVRSVDTLPSKAYFEIQLVTSSADFDFAFGICNATQSLTTFPNSLTNAYAVQSNASASPWTFAESSTGSPSVTGDTTGNVGFAVDTGAKKIWWRVGGGTWQPSGDPAAGTGGTTYTFTGSAYAHAFPGNASDSCTAKFSTASWTYSAPSGFGEINPTVADESISVREDYVSQVAIFAAWSDANEAAVQDLNWIQIVQADLAVDATQGLYQDWGQDPGHAAWVNDNERAVQDQTWVPIIQADLAVDATQGLYQDWGEDSGWPAWIAANENAVQDPAWFPPIGADAGGTTYNDTVTETGSASDTLTGLLAAVGTVTEAGSAADTVTGLRVSTDAVSEAGSAADTVAGLLVSTNAITEAGAAADTVSAALVAVGAVSETGAAAETLTTVLTAVGAITETGTAAETLTGLLVASAAISEAASAADTVTGGSLFNDSVSETASAADTVTVSVTLVGAVAETGSAADTPAAVLAALGAVSESGSASDTVSAALVAVGAISETASAVDTPDFVASQTYNESVSEAASAVDSLAATGGSVAAAEGLPYGGGVANVSRKRFKDLQRQIKAERKAGREAARTGGAAPQEAADGDAAPSAGIVAGGLLAGSAALPEAGDVHGPLLPIGTSPGVAAAEDLVARITAYQAQQQAHEAAVHAAMMQDEEEAVLVLLLAA